MEESMNKQIHTKHQYLQVGCKVITVSDTRTKENDKSGQLMIELLKQEKHSVLEYVIIKDDAQQIKREIIAGVQSDGIDCILLNGGTGISPRDVTIEAIKPFSQKNCMVWRIVPHAKLYRRHRLKCNFIKSDCWNHSKYGCFLYSRINGSGTSCDEQTNSPRIKPCSQ